VGPRVGLDAVARRKKNPCPCRRSNPGRPARSRVTVLTELTRIFACALSAIRDRNCGVVFTVPLPSPTWFVCRVFPTVPLKGNGIDRVISSIRVTPWGGIHAVAQFGVVEGPRCVYCQVGPHGSGL
jgi:hypothetical protein